jgi:DNA-binding GntR family transcriptional regulator
VAADLPRLAPRLRECGWHVQWYVHAHDLRRLVSWQKQTGLCFVLDHLAGLGASIPDNHPAWDATRALAAGGAWIELSGWYRLSAAAPYTALRPHVLRAAAMFGSRMVWGSDWPHTSFSPAHLPPYASTLLPIRSVFDESRVEAVLHGHPRLLQAPAPSRGLLRSVPTPMLRAMMDTSIHLVERYTHRQATRQMAPKSTPASRQSDVQASQTRYATAQNEVYEHLKQRILSGELAGGMRLNAVHIGAQLGVSRTPVREALHRLDIEGLVTLTPNRGVMVTSLTLEGVRELFKIRAALEALAASEAARKLREDDLDEFELLVRRMDRSRGDPTSWLIRHEALHDRLYQFAQMPRLAAEICRAREAIHPYLRLYIDVYHQTEMPGYEHRTLLSEVATGDPERAGRAMREHIESAASGVLEFLAGRPSA